MQIDLNGDYTSKNEIEKKCFYKNAFHLNTKFSDESFTVFVKASILSVLKFFLMPAVDYTRMRGFN